MGTGEITLRAYAKINLSLEVTGRRLNGYHDLRSLMQGIDLYDVIKITKCPQNGTKYNLPHCTFNEVVVYLCTDAKTIPTDMSNLAFKGIKAVLDEYSKRSAENSVYGDSGDNAYDLIVNLDKMLPVAAGIAGGSGNAAACMLGVNALIDSPFSLRDLMDIGIRVGSDVPFSLMMNARMNAGTLAGCGDHEELRGLEEASAAAWVSGIGDIVRPASPMSRHIIMANPGISVSTRAAYEAIDALQASAGDSAHTDDSDPAAWPLFVNDLELYTLRDYPEAARLKSVMQDELDADIVLMSGSGPTMVAYYEDCNKASADFDRMKALADEENSWRVWQTSTGML